MSKLYVALGDSMSIDDYAGGPGRGAASLLHRNRNHDFPDWSGQDLYTKGYDVLILARDGAVTADVLNRQVPQLTAAPDLVTITMGGNDLMSVYGDDTAAAQVIARVEAQAGGVLTRLRRLTTRIVLTTVYDPSDGTGIIPGGGLPAWPRGPHWINTLNRALTGLAARHHTLLADVHRAFHGHGVTAGDPAPADPTPQAPDLWFCGVIEPNTFGARAIRTTWWNTVQAAAEPLPHTGDGAR
ncbi:MAG TPA: SGNH/GDSL hydrolase family protein [Actinoplanes sp.]|nr:SGNH/GDSL hydrolase family protein [Actinoplanes sp.]